MHKSEHSHQSLVSSLLDSRLDEFIKKPFPERSHQLTPAMQQVLFSALGDIDEVEKNIREEKLIKLRQSFQNYKTYIKPIENTSITEQPKKLTEQQKKYYQDRFSELSLPDAVYDHSRYTDFLDYERMYNIYEEQIKLLYIRATDVVTTIMEKYKYSNIGDLDNPINIDRSIDINQELLDRIYGTNKQQIKMSLRRYIRERCTYFVLPTQERPYGVHPSFFYHLLNNYPESVFSEKRTFSGIMGEVWGNYCLSGYKDRNHEIMHINLTGTDDILADMFFKTDDIYKIYIHQDVDKPIWLAVDFKVKIKDFIQASKCTYDSSYADDYEIYMQKNALQFKKNILKEDGPTQIRFMESHVNWGTVDGTFFTLENMKMRRGYFVHSFLSAIPDSPKYIPELPEYYKDLANKKAQQRAMNPKYTKRPEKIVVTDYTVIIK